MIKLSFQFDPLLIQSVVDMYCGYHSGHPQGLEEVPSATPSVPSRSLNPVELNAIAYTSGYVIHKMLKLYVEDKEMTESLAEVIEGGRVDSVSMASDDEDFYAMATTYQSKADRGGLIWLPEAILRVFCRIEDHAFHFGQNMAQTSPHGTQPPSRSDSIFQACNDVAISG